MPDLFTPALDDLSADLQNVEQLLSLLRTVKSFAATDVPEGLDATPRFVSGAMGLRETIRRHSSDLSVLSGTLLLYLAGRFEHFVRLEFQALCDGFASKCQAFDQLPTKMRKSLHFYTAEVAREPKKYGFGEVEAVGFMVAYVGNVKATTGLGAINSACLSITQSNMWPPVVADLFKRIGVENIWGEIAKQAGIKVFFETDKDSEADKLAQGMLSDLMTIRNQIAHPSTSPSFPDIERVGAFLEFVLVLSQTLAAVTKTHYAAFKPPVQASAGGEAPPEGS